MGTPNLEILFSVIIPDILQPQKTGDYNKWGIYETEWPETAVFGHFWAIFGKYKPLKASEGTPSFWILFSVIIPDILQP